MSLSCTCKYFEVINYLVTCLWPPSAQIKRKWRHVKVKNWRGNSSCGKSKVNWRLRGEMSRIFREKRSKLSNLANFSRQLLSLSWPLVENLHPLPICSSFCFSFSGSQETLGVLETQLHNIYFITLFLSSSRLVRQNYVGTCHLHVFNLCHTHLVLVANTTFQLYDGRWKLMYFWVKRKCIFENARGKKYIGHVGWIKHK